MSSWKTATPSAENEIDLEYASILCKDPLSCIEAKESPVTMSYSGDVKTYVNSSDWTGLHYMVRTVTGGYYKASGTFTLPSVNLKSSLSDPDVPYGFFGIYVSDKIGLDLGTYDAYLNYCVKNRIVSSDKYSSLDAYATRAQIAHIFAKATSDFAVVNDIDYDYIPDVSERSEYADEILALYRAGILTGDERTRAFRPSDTITRAEAAAIISRVALPTTRIKIV